MMKRLSPFASAALAAVVLFGSPTEAGAQRVRVPSGGKAISNTLIGIFFEDISYAADGGLYAELVQNGSFEYNPSERDGWGPGTAWRQVRPGHSLGRLTPRMDNPIHPDNPTYMRLHVERVGHYYDYDGWTGFGLRNDGFDGISVKEGARYDFSVFLRNPDGKDKEIRVVLADAQRNVLADAVFTTGGSGWRSYGVRLTAAADCPQAHLQLLCLTTGELDVDMVSLMPEDTYKGHGLRRDLAEALEALHPKFVRFPGGCVVHGGGDGMWDTYRWKTTIGPKETRRGLKNTWGYHQSMGLGYYEYFQLCEDLGAEPLPILPCGVSCQGTNGGWGMRDKAQDVVPMDQMDEWVAEALDLIEWANGDASTEWGRKRAEAGHPEPFNLKYLGLGNEERISPEFEERFRYIYERVREKHPEIIIVGTAGPESHPGGWDYDRGWPFAESLGLPILDEHYYEPRDYFLNNQHNYDNYPRGRKTKVYLGEYAAKDKKLLDALYEALYLLGVERNGDVVVMTSYAPLFAKKGHLNWNPDLIYFDNERVYPSCSYYVQQFFGMSAGDHYYADVVRIANQDKYQGGSCVLDSQQGVLYLKVANGGEAAKRVSFDLRRFGCLPGQAEVLSISGTPDMENNFERQEVAPRRSMLPLKAKMEFVAEPYSFSLIRIPLR